MARERSPERDLAFEEFKKGDKSLKDIADQFHLPEGTIRGWKNKDKWNDRLKGTFRKNTERSDRALQSKQEQKQPPKAEAAVEELNPKQQLFCLYYLKNFNATQAYLKAYGCSYDTANAEGYKALVNPRIKREVDRMKELKMQSIMLTEDDIVERYMRIAFADITDFVEFGNIKVPVMTMFGPATEIDIITGAKVPLMKDVNDVKFKDSKMVDGGLICQIKTSKDGASLKLEDRQKALEWLSNYFNMDPMNRHKQEYDKNKNRIEEEKLSLLRTKAGEGTEEVVEDDGFIAALNAEAGKVWDDDKED